MQTLWEMGVGATQKVLFLFYYSQLWDFFGWLCNSILCYDEETQLLKTMVHFQSNGQRPMIDLEPCEHKLYQDYSQGISVDEAWEMAHRYYPPDKDNA